MTYYTRKKDGTFVEVNEGFKNKLIKAGKKTESDFISKSEYEAYNAPAETTQAQSTDGNVLNRDVDNKISLLSLLKPVYTGDLDKLIDYVRNGGNKPSGMNRKQEQIFSIVYSVMHSKDVEEGAARVDALEDNSYAKFIRNTVDRKGLYTDKEGNFRQPTVAEAVFPNVSSRHAKGASALSQGVGLYHDITTAPTRAATAAVASMTPYGQNLSFGQSMGRTVEASTGPENFFDFAVSSVPVGAGIVGTVGKVVPKLRAPVKFSDVVRDVNGKMKTGKRVVAERALKGAGEGAAYSVAPSAVMATSPEEESPFATFAEGVGLGAVAGAGIGAVGGGAELATARREGRFLKDETTPYTEELLEPKQALKRLKSAVRREPVKNAADIESDYIKILDETKSVAEDKLLADRKKMLEEIDARIARDKANASIRIPKKPQPPESPVEYVMDDVPVTSEREIVDPSDDYIDADYSNPPVVEVLPDYTPEDFDKLITEVNNERKALIADSEKAIEIKRSPAYEKMTQREKNEIDSRILTDAERQHFSDVDKAIQSGDIDAITDALGNSTAIDYDFDPYKIAMGMRSPIMEEPIVPGYPRKYMESPGVYKESPKSLQEDVVPDIIPDEDAIFGFVDESRSVETPTAPLKAPKSLQEDVVPDIIPDEDAIFGFVGESRSSETPTTRLKAPQSKQEQDPHKGFSTTERIVTPAFSMTMLMGAPKFGPRNLEKYLKTLPVDMEDFATKEWKRISSNLAKRDYAPSTTIEEITRLNKLIESSNDPAKQKIYKDLADKLRMSEEDISDFYLTPEDGEIDFTTGLPKNRDDLDKLNKLMEELPKPENIIKASKNRLETGIKSDFNRLVEQEKALNEIRKAAKLPEADILSAPVAANIRALEAPSSVTADDLLAGQARAGRGVILGVGEDALKLGKAYAKKTPKGGYAPALMSDQEFEYASPTDIPVDMLVKGGTQRVLLKAPKIWKSVDDIQ